MDELAGVVNLYPWYGAARKELCRRMAALGGDSWGVSQFADQAMYIGNRRSVAEVMRKGRSVDCSDKNLDELLSSYIDEKKPKQEKESRRVSIAGGDFFSASDYDSVRSADDNIFSGFKPKKTQTDGAANAPALDFCTETLAMIYLDQGYYGQAKAIYSKLILAIPEKSAYFASLIEKIDKLINNQTL